MNKRNLPQNSFKYVLEVLNSGFKKNHRLELEEQMSHFAGTRFSIGVSTGAAALHTALMSLGITKDDEILVSALTDYGSWTGALWEAGRVSFVDVDLMTGNVTPESLEKAITEKSKAFILTHLYGLPAEVDTIKAVCERHNIFLIEDCCQALGAIYRGKRVGSYGDLSAFSFAHSKQISCEVGGAICTSNEALERRCRNLAIDRGAEVREIDGIQQRIITRKGSNYRLSGLSMAVLLGQAEEYPEILAANQDNFAKLMDLIERTSFSEIDIIPVPSHCSHACWQFPVHVRAGMRDFQKTRNLMKTLSNSGFESTIRLQYYGPFHDVARSTKECPNAKEHIYSTVLIEWENLFTKSHLSAIQSILRDWEKAWTTRVN